MSSIEYDGDDPDFKAAMLRKLEQEIRREQAEADIAVQRAIQQRIKASDDQIANDISSSSDLYHCVHRFTGVVDNWTVQSAINAISFWKRTSQSGTRGFEIILNTPGGSVFDGMELFDYIREAEDDGYVSVTTVRGMAASMGAILSQAGTHRRMGRNALMLIHRPSSMASGELGQIEDTLAILNRICDRAVNVFMERSRDAAQPLSEDEFRSRWERKDWTLTADECLRYGFVDELV